MTEYFAARDREEARVAIVLEHLQEAQSRLLSGRSSVTAQAMILATWIERWPVESAIAIAKFLNGGQDEMRPRTPPVTDAAETNDARRVVGGIAQAADELNGSWLALEMGGSPYEVRLRAHDTAHRKLCFLLTGSTGP